MRSIAVPLRPRAMTWLLALTTAAAAVLASGPARAADVGVSIGISQPGVYGRIDIGRFPSPAVVVAQPVWVVRPPQPVQPVYLWVPPGHRQHWSRHCHAYGACGVPVYFVRDDWYRGHVMADQRGWAPPQARGRDRDDWRDGPGRGGPWRDDDRRGGGEGRGHGHGHGHRD